MMKRKGVLLHVEEGCTSNMQLSVSHSKEHLEQMLKDLLEEAGKVDLDPKPANCGGQAHTLQKRRRI